MAAILSRGDESTHNVWRDWTIGHGVWDSELDPYHNITVFNCQHICGMPSIPCVYNSPNTFVNLGNIYCPCPFPLFSNWGLPTHIIYARKLSHHRPRYFVSIRRQAFTGANTIFIIENSIRNKIQRRWNKNKNEVQYIWKNGSCVVQAQLYPWLSGRHA